MKYWRGYLVAAIVSACSLALMAFAQSHSALVDMVYPYLSRIIMTYMADWSSGVTFCIWQAVLILLGVMLAASIILMIVLRWHPVQWFGWVLAVVSVLFLAHTGIYGLNYYAGDLAEDVRLPVTEYTISELEAATDYLLGQANELSESVSRDSNGDVKMPEFDTLAKQAADGFTVLAYEEGNSVFAGSTVPVKELGWSGYYTGRGITGVTMGITGEAAVNPRVPGVGLPFAMCREMACRMSIVAEADANFTAFLACRANSNEEFRYSGYLMAFRYCYDALSQVTTANGEAAVRRIKGRISAKVQSDLDAYNDLFGADKTQTPTGMNSLFHVESDEEGASAYASVCDLLVSWHVKEFVLPLQVEEEVLFDPMDESQVNLSETTAPATAG